MDKQKEIENKGEIIDLKDKLCEVANQVEKIEKLVNLLQGLHYTNKITTTNDREKLYILNECYEDTETMLNVVSDYLIQIKEIVKI